ncbi:MAG: bifunctional nuclease family protein [Desulfosarcina sp.]|nr:bifunctional nuclease family protein [Desulfobacterales bacterium]
MLHKVQIAGMTIDPASNTPIILLKSQESDHMIPIWIGLFEASSIASILQDINFERPMTHDLVKNILDKLKISVSRIEISDLEENTFFAKIYFNGLESSFCMDARPSDAIAIALRFKASIFVDEKVIEKSAITVGSESAEVLDKSEEGKKWADYLKNLSPEDFGKYKI